MCRLQRALLPLRLIMRKSATATDKQHQRWPGGNRATEKVFYQDLLRVSFYLMADNGSFGGADVKAREL